MEQVIRSFPSKRNKLVLFVQEKQQLVRKHFANRADLECELAVYRQLSSSSLPHAKLVRISDTYIDFSYLSGISFAEILEQQGVSGIVDIAPWHKLVDWLLTFTTETGLVQQDCNLGNYLFDKASCIVSGIDFESCESGNPEQAIGQVCAHILANEPNVGHAIVDNISAYCTKLSIDSDFVCTQVSENTQKLQMRRKVAAVIVNKQKDIGQKQVNAALWGSDMELFHMHLRNIRNLGIAEIYTIGLPINESGVVNLPDSLDNIQAILNTSCKRNLLVIYLGSPPVDPDVLSVALDTKMSFSSHPVTVLHRSEKDKTLIAVYTKVFSP